MNQDTNKKFLSGTSPFRVLVILVIMLFVGWPLYTIGSLFVGCNIKTFNINKQSADIITEIEQIPIPTSGRTAIANGDCLTGSGTHFAFTANKSYPSILAAKNDISEKLAVTKIGAPALNDQPRYVSAGQYYSNGSYSDSGDTSIKEITLKYTLNEYDSIEFGIILDQIIPCEYTADNKVFCNGEEKDALIDKMVTNYPIDYLKVSGNIRLK